MESSGDVSTTDQNLWDVLSVRSALLGLVGTTLFHRARLHGSMARVKGPTVVRKYLVIWWAYQRPYYAVTADEAGAGWTANLRNGGVVEIEGTGGSLGKSSDR